MVKPSCFYTRAFLFISIMQYRELCSFDNYISAHIVLGMLQEEGISCHLKDEYTITIDPLLSPAIGGMKLMVHENQYNRAIELMDKIKRQG